MAESSGSNWTIEGSSGDPYRGDHDEGDRLFAEDLHKSYGAPWAAQDVAEHGEIIDTNALRTHIEGSTDRREDAARNLPRETAERGRAATSLGENVCIAPKE